MDMCGPVLNCWLQALLLLLLLCNARLGRPTNTCAAPRCRVHITGSKWVSNVCTDKNRCHTGGLYVTEGATVIMSQSTFLSNRVRTQTTGDAPLLTSVGDFCSSCRYGVRGAW
jgi:hypothetical protein